MSVDEKVTTDLIETVEDGKEGFAKGADKLQGTADPALSATFRRFSEQRAGFSAELRGIARQYGDKIDQGGSVAGTLHRGWMSLKDALSGSDPDGVLKAAAQGEEHAVKEYDNALASDISPELRTINERQAAQVRAAQAEVQALHQAKK